MRVSRLVLGWLVCSETPRHGFRVAAVGDEPTDEHLTAAVADAIDRAASVIEFSVKRRVPCLCRPRAVAVRAPRFRPACCPFARVRVFCRAVC